MMEEIKEKILNYMKSEFDADDELDYDTNIFEEGYADSLDSTKIISYLEEEFGIKITTKEIMLYPMNTINEMADVVNKLK